MPTIMPSNNTTGGQNPSSLSGVSNVTDHLHGHREDDKHSPTKLAESAAAAASQGTTATGTQQV
jgi:hypothetical protein